MVIFMAVMIFFNLCEIPSFFKTIPSNLITFGYIDGNFFEHQHETPEAFDADEAKYMPCNTDKAWAAEWSEDVEKNFINMKVELKD